MGNVVHKKIHLHILPSTFVAEEVCACEQAFESHFTHYTLHLMPILIQFVSVPINSQALDSILIQFNLMSNLVTSLLRISFSKCIMLVLTLYYSIY